MHSCIKVSLRYKKSEPGSAHPETGCALPSFAVASLTDGNAADDKIGGAESLITDRMEH